MTTKPNSDRHPTVDLPAQFEGPRLPTTYSGAYCEDYPCCGHTPDDPCAPQEYDRPGYYDTSIPGNEHALCDHENGECNVDGYY